MRMSSPSDDDLVEIEPDAAVPDAHHLPLVIRGEPGRWWFSVQYI